MGIVNDCAVILHGSHRSPTEFLVVCPIEFSASYSFAGGDKDDAVQCADCEEKGCALAPLPSC